MSKSKLKFGRVNKSTLARIYDLREVLVFLEAHPNSTKVDVEEKFKWSNSKCSKIVQDLVTCGLAKNVGTTKGKTSSSKLYSAVPHTEEDLDRELPLSLELSKSSGRPEVPSLARRVIIWGPGQAKRDLLDTYLMGTGLAPSILFHRGQDGTA